MFGIINHERCVSRTKRCHHTAVGLDIKEAEDNELMKSWKKGNLHTAVLVMQVTAITVENLT